MLNGEASVQGAVAQSENSHPFKLQTCHASGQTRLRLRLRLLSKDSLRRSSLGRCRFELGCKSIRRFTVGGAAFVDAQVAEDEAEENGLNTDGGKGASGYHGACGFEWVEVTEAGGGPTEEG